MALNYSWQCGIWKRVITFTAGCEGSCGPPNVQDITSSLRWREKVLGPIVRYVTIRSRLYHCYFRAIYVRGLQERTPVVEPRSTYSLLRRNNEACQYCQVKPYTLSNGSCIGSTWSQHVPEHFQLVHPIRWNISWSTIWPILLCLFSILFATRSPSYYPGS